MSGPPQQNFFEVQMMQVARLPQRPGCDMTQRGEKGGRWWKYVKVVKGNLDHPGSGHLIFKATPGCLS